MQQFDVINTLKKDLNFTDQSIEKLKVFTNLVLKENKNYNLIAKSTENQIWARHVLDSAQLVKFIDFKRNSLADLGTGRFQHNFTNNMSSGNYSGHMSLRNNLNQWWVGGYTTTQCSTNSYTGSSYSDQHHKLAVFGDLA